MKILEITEFSAGICGVWTRVLSESQEFLEKGYEVVVFSSNIVKGTDKLARCEDEIDGVRIKRFTSKTGKALTKNVNYFNFEEELVEENPDIVITHLMHPHSFKALKICMKKKIPCYLVTHAPFNVKRRFPLNLATSIYYAFKKYFLNKFTGIIAITKWEFPYLLSMGVEKEKIAYIPNGIPDEFFKQKKAKPKKDVLFLGRISPVKNIELLLKAAKLLPAIKFSIVGSSEKDYLGKLNDIIRKENLENVKIYPPVYDLKKKIRLIDEHKIFVLPSKREAMPQALLEAMARGKIVISSKTDGGKEIIKNKSGFLFDVWNCKMLAKLINENIKGNRAVQKRAEKEARGYSWSNLIKSYLKLFKK